MLTMREFVKVCKTIYLTIHHFDPSLSVNEFNWKRRQIYIQGICKGFMLRGPK